jgi:hypothetical protein
MHFNVLSSTFVLGPQLFIVWKIFPAVILYICLLCSIQATSLSHRNLIYLSVLTTLEKM